MADLIAQGLTNRQIGARLFIAERTVDTHVGRILAKLGCTSRAQAAAIVAAAAAVTAATRKRPTGPGRVPGQPAAGVRPENTYRGYAFSPIRHRGAGATVTRWPPSWCSATCPG